MSRASGAGAALRAVALWFAAGALVFGTGFLLLLSRPVGAREQVALAQAPRTAPSEIVRVAVPWSVTGADLVCSVTENRSRNPDSLPTRKLIVYSEKQDPSQPMFTVETPDTPLGISPLGEYNARLLVAWAGGSAYHFQVLAYINGTVREVLAKSSRAFPEIVRDQQGNELLLFTKLRLEESQWRRQHGTTEVFGWTGHGYERFGRVPWLKRLECASREACSSIR